MPEPAAHPMIAAQITRLIDLGVPALAGLDEAGFRAVAAPLTAWDEPGSDRARSGMTLAVHPSLVAACDLATLLRRGDRPGFVVEDMTDLADFTPIPETAIPDAPLYLISDIERGDDMLNWSPDEARPAIGARDRSPLTISEGISWLLQEPEQLEPGTCFMCIGSRKPAARPSKTKPFDARTPALWISGGTGRDGKERRGAPKVGWCWAGNRHTWLGFASTAGRIDGRAVR